MPRNKSELDARVHSLKNPITGFINVPGSKSYTNRALIISSLANGVSEIYGYSGSDDSLLLIKLLKKLGIKITTNDENEFRTCHN